MYPYYFLVFVPIFVSIIPIKNRKKRIISLFFIFLFVMLALRDVSIGCDLSSYLVIFRSYATLNWSSIISKSTEVAYGLLNKIVAEVTNNNFQCLLAIIAAITIIPLSYVYSKQVEDPILTIILFVSMSTFVMFFSGIRQGISIALGMIAFEFTRKKKLVPFLVIVLLAVLFHSSAFMLLFMYPLYYAKITKKWSIIVIPTLLVIFIFNKQIFSFLLEILGRFTEYDTKYGTIESTGAYGTLILFLLFAIYSYAIPDEAHLDKDTIGMRNFLLLSVVLQMFAPLHSIAMRMNYYYIVFIPLLIPKIIKNSSVQWKKIANYSRYILIIFFLIYFFFIVTKENVLDTFPYKFFWVKN